MRPLYERSSIVDEPQYIAMFMTADSPNAIMAHGR